MKKPKLKRNKYFQGYKKLKHVKLFENFDQEEFKEGDMVYVDNRGPMTYGYDGAKADTPRRPVVYGNFKPDTQYEIVSFDKGMYGLYDEDNEFQQMPARQLSKEQVVDGDTRPSKGARRGEAVQHRRR